MDTEHPHQPLKVARPLTIGAKNWRKALDIVNAHELAVMREEVRRLEAELEQAHQDHLFWKRLRKGRIYGI